MSQKPNKYTEEQIAEAKSMYMRYVPVTEISEKTKMSVPSINYYIKNYWVDKRKERQLALVSALSESKRTTMAEIMRDGIEAVRVAMKQVLRNAPDMTIDQADKVMKLLMNIDKIDRLDRGDPTEITSNNPEKVIEVVNPFYIEGEDEIISLDDLKDMGNDE